MTNLILRECGFHALKVAFVQHLIDNRGICLTYFMILLSLLFPCDFFLWFLQTMQKKTYAHLKT